MFQPTCTVIVVVCLLLMLAAVKFYDQPPLVADEVNNVLAHGFLVSELVAKHLMATKVAPEELFRLG